MFVGRLLLRVAHTLCKLYRRVSLPKQFVKYKLFNSNFVSYSSRDLYASIYVELAKDTADITQLIFLRLLYLSNKLRFGTLRFDSVSGRRIRVTSSCRPSAARTNGTKRTPTEAALAYYNCRSATSAVSADRYNTEML